MEKERTDCGNDYIDAKTKMLDNCVFIWREG
jgi:hypothetical protein